MLGAELGPVRLGAVALVLGAAVVAMVGLFLASPGLNGGAQAQSAPPRIFATGDSMMRYLDGRLGADLAITQPVSFSFEHRVGSGISKENWVRIARRQVREHGPRATVVFIGAADGFVMEGARCCGRHWSDVYAKRVKKIIRVYSRKGLGDVYWLNLPTPRDARRTRIFKSVNRAIRLAVRASGPHAHLIDTAAVLTPGGRYRRTMIFQGKRVVIRTKDGCHLASAGHAVLTPYIIEAMRRDGIVR